MSSPSTPTRSIGVSASSTPSGEANGSQLDQLTPRSKVKAMLAALDDSDDDNPFTQIPSRTGSARARIVRTWEHGDNPCTDSSGKKSDKRNGRDESEENELDDDVVAPRGKLASRLYGQKSMNEDQGYHTTNCDTTGAYSRVKQQLLQKAQPPVRAANEKATSESSENELGMTRKLFTRRKRPRTIDREDDEPHTKSPQSQRSSPRVSQIPKRSRILENTSSDRTSPSLFLTPGIDKSSAARISPVSSSGSDSDIPTNPTVRARVLALAAQKKIERQAREAAERKEQRVKYASLSAQSKKPARQEVNTIQDSSESDSEDGAAGRRKLTQQSRPARKASKKAIEEMSRETQRMNRNMQLAHQAKTKRKITKDSFMARFKYSGNRLDVSSTLQATSSSTVGSSAHVSENDGARDHETPPTSPIRSLDNKPETAKVAESIQTLDNLDVGLQDGLESEIPSVEHIMVRSAQQANKGKSKVKEESPPHVINDLNGAKKTQKTQLIQPAIEIGTSKLSNQRKIQLDDLDSDLEILPMVQRKSKPRDVFDRLPKQKVTQTRSLQTLRALAHLTSPSKLMSKAKVASVTPSEMQTSLQRLARQQAAQERAEKLQVLKDKGVIIQTAEEIERDQAELEDLLEKTRREVEQITKKEKDAAKKERRDNGETVLEDSSEDDEEYTEERSNVPNMELSGSEEEELEEGEEELSDDEDEDDKNGVERGGFEEVSSEEGEDDKGGVVGSEKVQGVGSLVDNEASEDSEENASGEDVEAPTKQNQRRNRVLRVIDEEEDDEDDHQEYSDFSSSTKNPLIPNLHGCNDAPMGLTQAFAATMADSQTQQGSNARDLDDEQDSLAFLRDMPEDDFPMVVGDKAESQVPDSQPEQLSLGGTSQIGSGDADVNLHLSQFRLDHDGTPAANEVFATATQYSEIPDPSQDVGFDTSLPVANRFVSVPPSTTETVILPKANINELIVKKKGRLIRRLEAAPVVSKVDEDEDIDLDLQDNQFAVRADAFDVLKQASKKAVPRNDLFDKGKSDAKGMVEEQAQESEDEYAGLGGASDEESGSEVDEEVRKMVDDGDIKVDERKLAAFHA